MPGATIGNLNFKLNADPGGLVAGFGVAQRQARTLAGTFRLMQAEMAKQQARGAEIALSVRTPREQLAATLLDLRRLRADGAISFDTFNRAADAAKAKARDLAMAGIEPIIGRMRQMALIGAGAVAGFLGWGVKLASDAQTAEVSFTAMLKSGEAARAMLGRLREMAKATPFEFTELRQAAQTLVGMGIAAADVMPSLRMLGDISAGSGKNVTELALIFGQVSAAGRLMTQDMNQLATAGIPILDALAKKFGVAKQDVRALVEAGKVDFATLQEAMRSMTMNGGLYFQMMERRSQTLQGKWSTLMDATKELATAFGTVLVPPLLKVVNTMIPFVELMSKLDSATVGVGLGAAALVAGFAGAVIVAAKTANAVRDLVTVMRTLTQVMATQKIITQALAGPKGWGMLAVGAAVAAVGIYGLNKAIGSNKEGTVTATISAAEMRHNLEMEAEAAKNAASSIKKTTEAVSEFASITDQAFTTATARVAEFADTAKETERLLDRAKDITLEVRTPEEKFRDTIKELETLRMMGAITGEVFFRAFDRAADDLQNAQENAEGLKQELGGIAAATFDTVAGFSLVQELLRKNSEEAKKKFLPNIDFGQDGMPLLGGPRSMASPAVAFEKSSEKLTEANGYLKDIARATRDNLEISRTIAAKREIQVSEVDL